MDTACSGIFVRAPSTVVVGESFSVGVKVLTEPYEVPAACYVGFPGVQGRYNDSPRGFRYMDNVPPHWQGRLRLSGEPTYEGPDEVSLEDGPYPDDHRPIGRVGPVRFTEPGMHILTCMEPSSGAVGRSNPILVTAREPAARLFWGDIHSQTFFSDGLRCPEEIYLFAREESFLDIFALADHAEKLTDRQWEYFTAVTNDFNRAGSFVTLVGLEWSSREYGHRNVYYPGEAGPILRSDHAVQGRLPHVYEIARKHGALVIPHHSANVEMGVDWDLGHDPEVERLVEVYSIWGNSERPAHMGNPRPIRVHRGEKDGRHVIDALRRGYRFGMIGSGDIHDGRPGDELHHIRRVPEHYPGLYRQGLMGVWCEELTRQNVFDALWNRRVYATTNVRILLRFSVAGQPMGSEIRHKGVLSVAVEAASEVPIHCLELVRNGADHQQLCPDQPHVRWELDDTPEGDLTWYYVRVTRQDGEMAWSSPVWVQPE